MTVYKCDLCRKQIKNNDEITVYNKFYKTLLCFICAKPIVKFLDRQGLTEKVKE